MTRAKGRRMAKKDRWMFNSKNQRLDGWYTYAGPNPKLQGQRALVRFTSDKTCMALFNHGSAFGLEPWAKYDASDFMKTETWEKQNVTV